MCPVVDKCGMAKTHHVTETFQAVDEAGNTYEVRRISEMYEYTDIKGKPRRIRGGYHYETSDEIVLDDLDRDTFENVDLGLRLFRKPNQ